MAHITTPPLPFITRATTREEIKAELNLIYNLLRDRQGAIMYYRLRELENRLYILMLDPIKDKEEISRLEIRRAYCEKMIHVAAVAEDHPGVYHIEKETNGGDPVITIKTSYLRDMQKFDPDGFLSLPQQLRDKLAAIDTGAWVVA